MTDKESELVKFKPNPQCHPIEGININVDFTNGLVAGMASIVHGFENWTLVTWSRSTESVWLAKTSKEGVYECPVNVMGYCKRNIHCFPEDDSVKRVVCRE